MKMPRDNVTTLRGRMNLLVKRGIFESEESLTASAISSLLTMRPELRLEIALGLYEDEEISLGRAAEMAGLSREQMKEVLSSRGIERKFPESPPEQVDRDVQWLLQRP